MRRINHLKFNALLTFFLLLNFAAIADQSSQEQKQSASRMAQAAQTTLNPVYEPLAEWITSQFDLKNKSGVGIDLGSGPGNLIIELCQKNSLHWINADINPHFFPQFMTLAETHLLTGQVSAIYAPAEDLPFKDQYADVIVSRGSYPFWDDLKQGLSEVYRVLKPGGAALIGRGFSPNLPLDTAIAIRKQQGRKSGGPPYTIEETKATFHQIMNELNITNYKIHTPHPNIDEVSYGIWLEFSK